MFKRGYNIVLILLLCIGGFLMGCSSNDNDVIGPEEGGTAHYYLNLKLNMGQATTRAVEDHPYGGEDGDGREDGHNYENDIEDFTIFIYEDTEGNGVNDAASTTFKYRQYIGGIYLSSIAGIYETGPIKITGTGDKAYIPSDKDRILVVANMGDLTSSITTLGGLRDKMVSSAWTAGADITKYHYFAMSSSVDGIVSGIDYGKMNVTDYTGTEWDPFNAQVQIERVAARIDFWMIKNLEGKDYVSYEVGTGTDKDEFRLSHVRIVNGSQKPTYNLKRTASAVNPSVTDIKYLGEETVKTGTKIPTNYVVEPLTYLKNNTKYASSDDLEDWFGASRLSESQSTTFLSSDNYKISAHKNEQFKVTETDTDIDDLDGTHGDGVTCYTLDYVMENTMDKTGQVNEYRTGLELKGTYVPNAKNVKILKSDGTLDIATGYTAGDDFYYYVKADKSEKIFFQTETDAKSYRAKSGKYGTIKKYTKGECYYYVWIRHAMFGTGTGEGTGQFPMEYGIVRNNIYRIGVEKVSEIGSNVPDPGDDPLLGKIYVRPWRYRSHVDIAL